MIGKVQDIVSAAVVIGAAEKTGGSGANSSQRGAKGSSYQVNMGVDTSGRGPAAVVDMQGMEKDDPNDISAEKQKQREDAKMDEKAVSAMTDELNKLMENINCNLSFTYHKEVDVMSVKMIDKKTDEVIKEFPPEEMVESMIRAKEWIGALLDKNA